MLAVRSGCGPGTCLFAFAIWWARVFGGGGSQFGVLCFRFPSDFHGGLLGGSSLDPFFFFFLLSADFDGICVHYLVRFDVFVMFACVEVLCAFQS